MGHLRCPACRGSLDLAQRAVGPDVPRIEGEELVEGELHCSDCEAAYRVVGGIPVLLPPRVPNPEEREVRRRVSEDVAAGLEGWRQVYDRHHFRARSELEIARFLARSEGATRPRLLDVGIGWGAAYLPFAERLELWGIDFSLESLLLARRIYAAEGATPPELVCASLDAIPIGGMRFDWVRSTQVYQHIADQRAIRSSLRQVIEELLADRGEFTVENLSFRYARLPGRLMRIRRRWAPPVGRERSTADYYLRYYLPGDFRSLLADIAEPRIGYSEVIFHPELRLIPRSALAARLDAVLSRLPGAGLLARQIRMTVMAEAPGPD